jgi:hypothetical protein
LKSGIRDHLTEEAFVRGFEKAPRGLEGEALRRSELERDHHALAAYFLEELVLVDQSLEVTEDLAA